MPSDLYAAVAIPGGIPEPLTYRVPASCGVERGSVVRVPVGSRSLLGIVLSTSGDVPSFPTRELALHPSGHVFPSSWVDSVEWVGRYYMAGTNHSLDVFLPSDLDALLTAAYGNDSRIARKAREKAPERTILEPPPLTQAQATVVGQLQAWRTSTGFGVLLLRGITGSGKTRVYLELVRDVLAEGGQVLVLVPEIALTPQTAQRFQEHVGEEVLLLHSALSAPVRRRTWVQLLRGEARFVLGTRSAALVPHFSPSLVVVDECHDASYKQDDPAPRYHARDVLFAAAHRSGTKVLLGSATPSIEDWYNAREGRMGLLRLDRRAVEVPLPPVQVVDRKEEMRLEGDRMLGSTLREAVTETIRSGGQCILLHNRRGFATARVCRSCGEIHHCMDCRVPTTYHRRRHMLLCHYCSRCYLPDEPCKVCGSTDFEYPGGAIEKVEQELRDWLPGIRVLRLDRDTVDRIGAAEAMLDAFRRREYDVLLGTQMVAKGHDFPGVHLVGVVSADTGSQLPDFRAAERNFQLLTQVAGRAGRSQEGGRVVVQTMRPDDPVLRFALKHDYEGFAAWELANRQAAAYPPYVRLLVAEFAARQLDNAEEAADTFCSAIRSTRIPGCSVLGPAEAFVTPVRGKHRVQVLLRGARAQDLRIACNSGLVALPSQLAHKVTIRLDPDPASTL